MRSISLFYLASCLCCVLNVKTCVGFVVGDIQENRNSRKSASLTTQLPLNDINIITVTDVHSWVAGHGYHEPDLDADYGYVLSFYQRLKEICRSEGRDLFLVMNGDFMDGTGLTTNPPKHLIPILEKMPWDAVNIGNHELYKKTTVDYISVSGGFIDKLGGRYLSSNVRHAASEEYLGSRAKFIRGEFGNTILAFGFLYDMTNEDKSIKVDQVEAVVREAWFRELLEEKSGKFDAILVLAHMDVNDPLVHIILGSIRATCGDDMPVQFVTGHTHYRGFKKLDDKSVSFEAGHYLDTVGYMSFSKNGEFEHVFIESNIATLASKVNLDASNLLTAEGKNLSEFIHRTQENTGLLDVLGCSPANFYRNRTLDKPDSLFALYLNEIVSEYLFAGNTSKVLVQARGDFRYDLFSGFVTTTDLSSVSPFGDKYNLISTRILGSEIDSLISDLNRNSEPSFDSIYYAVDQIKHLELPRYFRSGGILNESNTYDVYSADFIANTVAITLETILDGNHSISPKLVFPLTDNSNIWIDFIGKKWQCMSFSTRNKTRKDISSIRIFFAIILLGGGSALFAFVLFKFSQVSKKESDGNAQTSVNGEKVEDYDTIERTPGSRVV